MAQTPVISTGREECRQARQTQMQEAAPHILETIRKTGQVWPTVYARFAGNAIAPYPLESFTGETKAKASQLFLLGRQVGRRAENVNRELQEMGFLSEMFFAQTNKLKPGERPRNAPSRKEGLLWLSVSGQPPFDAEVAVYELKRRSGKVSGLAPVEIAVRLEEIIIYGFIAGVRSCQLTDEQLPNPLDIRSFLK